VLSVLEAKVGFDARIVISRSIERGDRNDREFMARAFSENGIPKDRSKRLRELEAMLDEGRSMAQTELLRTGQVEKLLRTKTLLKRASDTLLQLVPDISKASQFIDQAILTSSAAAFGPSQVARSRLETLRRTSGSNNVLARLEIDGLIDAAVKLIERQTDEVGMARLGWLASEFHTREGLARTEFDSRRYAAAIHRLLAC